MPGDERGQSEDLRARVRRRTREEVAQVAFDLFAERGFEPTTAEEVAENFWVFSLNGTMGPEEGTEKEAEGTLHAGEEEPTETGETPAEEPATKAKEPKQPKAAKRPR